jgi:phenylpyruvate tautomerase PptA (4-oxalocrotonate tautomerase family)
MPMIDVTYPEGALDDDARTKLVDDLTTALLRAERAPDTEFFRSITWVYLHELPAHAVNAAGKPVSEPVFRVMVTTPEGALSDRRRAEMVENGTAAVLEAAGLTKDDSMRVWILMREIDEGSWGAAGQVIQFKQLVEAAKAERESAGSGSAEVVGEPVAAS